MWKRSDRADRVSNNLTNGASSPTLSSSQSQDYRSSKALVNRSPSGVPAVLGNTVAIKGEITGNEDLIINGVVQGSVALGGFIVTIGTEGRVTADLYASEVEVEGLVEGDIVAEDRITIRSNGVVTGNIKAPRIVLEEGCQFKGSVAMDSSAVHDSYSSGIVDIDTASSEETPASYVLNKSE